MSKNLKKTLKTYLILLLLALQPLKTLNPLSIGCVEFYEHYYHTGLSKKYCQSSSQIPDFDNFMTSFTLGPYTAIKLFQNENFSGKSLYFEKSLENIYYIGLNDEVSSFQIILLIEDKCVTLQGFECSRKIENGFVCQDELGNFCIQCLNGFFLYGSECLKCEENCLECIDFGFGSKCVKCEGFFRIFNFKCVEEICFSEFCKECNFDLKKDCDVCYECGNLDFVGGAFLNCGELKENCEYCYFKYADSFDCLICEQGYVYQKIKGECVVERIFENDDFDGDLVFSKSKKFFQFCQNGYFYDEFEEDCFLISQNCKFGCLSCFGETKKCLICGNKFYLENLECIFKNPIEKILEGSNLFQNALDYFFFDENLCFNIINNITFKIENNITIFFEEKIFLNKKDFEIKEFYIDCVKERKKCEKYNKIKYPKSIYENENGNCKEIYEHNFVNNIKIKKNTTLYNYKEFCLEKKEENEEKYEKMICQENTNCSNFTKILNIQNYSDVYNCKNDKEKKTKKNLIFEKENYFTHLKIEKCEICQKKNYYFCPLEKHCLKKCEFVLKQNRGKYYLENTDKNSKISLLINLIQKEIPDFVKINFDYENQRLNINFLKNNKNAILEIRPIFINFAKNCTLRKKLIFKIENSNFLKIFRFFKYFKPYNNQFSNFFIKLTLNFFCFFFIPLYFYEFLQIFELFGYFYFLDIDGGSVYNNISALSKDFYDSDFFFIDNKKFYDYKIGKFDFNFLLKISIFDIYFIFGILFIILIRKYLNSNIDFRKQKNNNLKLKLIKKKKIFINLEN